MGASDAQQSLGATASRSSLACGPCRRKKARCDRTLPHCAVCARSMQVCAYPAGRLKPGPRVGSTRRSRKPARRLRQSPESDAGSGREERALLSPTATENVDTSAGGSFGGIHLSTIIHPSHETAVASPREENYENTSGFFVTLAGPPDMIMGACRDLHVSLAALRKLIDAFNTNMTAFSLVHWPSFSTKIQNITSPSILKAGFAAMLTFGAHFETPPPDRVDEGSLNGVLVGTPSHEQFHRLSLQFLEAAIAECADEPPSLCLLQVLILTTFYQLIRGVRGRAWRSLGLCVRMAYELGLHQVDSGDPYRQAPEATDGLTRWCFDEERRRAWWAIWEMDVFASTIRRCPTAIDWAENETWLPVADHFWFGRNFRQSCYLERKPVERLRALTESRNEGPTAWLIVVISLMREAHLLSKPKGPLHGSQIGGQRGSIATQPGKRQTTDVSEHLAIISNALHCFSLALPEELRYRGEYLSFESADSRPLHSSKFSIHLMKQLTTLMAYRNCLGPSARQQSESTSSGDKGPDGQGLRRYVEASDSIFTIIKNSAEDHVRHVNPFLASTVWFAAAVQLAYKLNAPPGTNTDLVESKFELLRMNCQQYAKFWATPDALLENLSILENHLESQLGGDLSRAGDGSNQTGEDDGPGQRARDWTDEVDSAIPLGSHNSPAAVCPVVPPDSSQYRPADGDQGGSASLVDEALTGFSMGMDMDFGLETGDMSLCLDGLLFDSHAA